MDRPFLPGVSHQPFGGKADHLAQQIGVFSLSVRRFVMSSVIGGSSEMGFGVNNQTLPESANDHRHRSLATALLVARSPAAS
ncbi:hypothetical protein MPLDJ20_220010 [Mesorhizobium plurifarium]|uniref:Uncharacterized protein n=1 Tax=Mesorhizobium plurifarium TaxID=69974 RepID=A0A090F2A3_MESPL|nr:hypothetical protein MPLDJ20_220010 [Mesorhizobium plurifarium]